MKKIFLLAQSCLLIATFSTSTLAAQTGKDCEGKAKALAASKRDAFLVTCLAQASSTANVKEVVLQNKRRTCEQNAKNLQLNGGSKAGYIEKCMNKNEAFAEAKKSTNATPPPASASASASKPIAKVTKKTCAQQAKERDLKGHARKHFMGSCSNK